MRLSQKLLLWIICFMIAGIGLTSFYSAFHARRRIAAMGMADARRSAETVFEALFTSMSTGAGRKGNRAVIERLSRIEDIDEVRLIHGPPIDRQFGVEEDEMARDGLDRGALSGKEAETVEGDGKGAGGWASWAEVPAASPLRTTSASLATPGPCSSARYAPVGASTPTSMPH